MKNLKVHYLYIILIFASIIIAYHQLPGSYFEQDEWHSFGYYNYLLSLPAPDFIRAILGSNPLNHFTPLSLFLKMGLYRMAGLNAAFYFFASIFLHILTALSVYFLIFFLLKKRWSAFLGSLFFAVNSSHHQAVTWIGTFEGTEGATLFGTVALICSLLYLEKKGVKFFYLSLIAIFLALLFKEIALTFVFILVGILLFRLHGKPKITSLLNLGKVLAFYFFLRFSYLFLGKASYQTVLNQGTVSAIKAFPYNFISLPIKIFAQIVLPNDLLIQYTKQFSFFAVPPLLLKGPWTLGDVFRYDALTIPVGLLVLILILWLGRRTMDKFTAYIGISLIVSTAALFVFFRKYFVYLDSRYLYPATIGAGIFIASLAKYKKGTGLFWAGLPYVLFVFLIASHLYALNLEISAAVQRGSERQSILAQIKALYPRLKQRMVIFAESDSMYYGLPERILPFQSGLGQVLLVNYRQSQNIPPKFFANEFLWDIRSQGYQEMDQFGFGFFWNVEELASAMTTQGIDLDAIYGIAYDSQLGKVVDITPRVRGEIVGFRAQKQEINLSDVKVSASYNQENVRLAVDGHRETNWSSVMPYSMPQYFEVDLGRFVKIAQVRIDSFTNKDQNGVGYVISLSADGQNWREVFKSRRHTPGKNGLVDVFLLPQESRYLRIKQIGYHKYAPWVIHELKLYEIVD